MDLGMAELKTLEIEGPKELRGGRIEDPWDWETLRSVDLKTLKAKGPWDLDSANLKTLETKGNQVEDRETKQKELSSTREHQT